MGKRAFDFGDPRHRDVEQHHTIARPPSPLRLDGDVPRSIAGGERILESHAVAPGTDVVGVLAAELDAGAILLHAFDDARPPQRTTNERPTNTGGERSPYKAALGTLRAETPANRAPGSMASFGTRVTGAAGLARVHAGRHRTMRRRPRTRVQLRRCGLLGELATQLSCAYAVRMKAAVGAARKTATNLSVRADLVQRARALKLNLSSIFESALERALLDAEREIWLEDNSDAIADYNARVAKHGTFSDDWRRF